MRKEKQFDLLDGASSDIETLPKIDDQRKVVTDKTLDLEERLEAFEDVFESQVGDTNLIRSRNIERELGLRQLYLKFEGANPSGTQKDRIAFAQVMDAMRRGFDVITMATCGNYGVAMSIAANVGGLRCLVYIPERYHTKRIKEMEEYGVKIVRFPGDYEAAVLASSELAEKSEFYDANPGGANTSLQLRAYGEISYEIYDELRDAPAVVALPVSNGTTLAGIYRGFQSLYRRGKTSHMPRIVAGSSFNKNPIVQAFKKNLTHCEDLQPDKIKESFVNEPLINWHSIDGDYALSAIRETHGWAENASDKNMLYFSKLLRDKEGLSVLPASTAGMIALITQHKREAITNDRFVFLITGRK